jgi:uncharacterized protein YaaR (DUF327 family)
MDLRVSQLQQPAQIDTKTTAPESDGSFRFTLLSSIQEQELQASLAVMMEDITQQGNKLSRKMDIRDMKLYRRMIKEFMNEIVTHSHSFSRENFLDKKGRHRVYGMVKLIDQALDDLAEELMREEQDHLAILNKIGEIQGMILDLFT